MKSKILFLSSLAVLASCGSKKNGTECIGTVDHSCNQNQTSTLKATNITKTITTSDRFEYIKVTTDLLTKMISESNVKPFDEYYVNRLYKTYSEKEVLGGIKDSKGNIVCKYTYDHDLYLTISKTGRYAEIEIISNKKPDSICSTKDNLANNVYVSIFNGPNSQKNLKLELMNRLRKRSDSIAVAAGGAFYDKLVQIDIMGSGFVIKNESGEIARYEKNLNDSTSILAENSFEKSSLLEQSEMNNVLEEIKLINKNEEVWSLSVDGIYSPDLSFYARENNATWKNINIWNVFKDNGFEFNDSSLEK